MPKQRLQTSFESLDVEEPLKFSCSSLIPLVDLWFSVSVGSPKAEFNSDGDSEKQL